MARSHSIYLLVDNTTYSVNDIAACFTVKHEALSYAERMYGKNWKQEWVLIRTGDNTEFNPKDITND